LAVVRLVISIDIDPVERKPQPISIAQCPELKVFETLSPFLADYNTAATPMFIVWTIGITAVLHLHPFEIQRLIMTQAITISAFGASRAAFFTSGRSKDMAIYNIVGTAVAVDEIFWISCSTWTYASNDHTRAISFSDFHNRPSFGRFGIGHRSSSFCHSERERLSHEIRSGRLS
jgi:hypothetical protein